MSDDAFLPDLMATFPISGPPTMATMQHWADNGYALATDGCKVEPDGYCPHGCPSWLLVYDLI